MQGNTATISRLVLAGVAAAYALVMIVVAPDAPVTQPDSASYLAFSSYRTATYPLFIKLVGLNSLTIVQTLLFAGALAVLGFETLASTRNLAVAAILMIGVAANPELNKYHSVVMTESLFMSALLVFLAMLVRFVRLKDLLSLGLAAALAGVAATIRPTGLALLPIPILMVLACRRQLKSPVLALMSVALLPAIMLVAGERALSHFIHQGNLASLAPRHIFAKAAMIDAPPASTTETDPLRRALLVAIENDFAPIRALIAQADRNTRIPMTVHYETCVEYVCSDPLRARNASPRFEAEMLQVGLQRLASAPLNYAGLVWTHYRALWTLYTQTHPATAPVFAEFIRNHRPLPFEDLVSPLVEDSTDQPRRKRRAAGHPRGRLDHRCHHPAGRGRRIQRPAARCGGRRMAVGAGDPRIVPVHRRGGRWHRALYAFDVAGDGDVVDFCGVVRRHASSESGRLSRCDSCTQARRTRAGDGRSSRRMRAGRLAFVLRDDERWKGGIGFDAGVRQVHPDVDPDIRYVAVDSREIHLRRADRKARRLQGLRTTRRNRIARDSESAQQRQRPRDDVLRSECVDAGHHRTLVEPAQAPRHAGHEIDQQVGIEIPAPQDEVPVRREHFDQRLRRLRVVEVEDRVVLANRDALLLVDRLGP